MTIGEVRARVARGIGPGWGIEVEAPYRVVKSTIRFEDLDRQPANPPNGSIHHRNETRTGFSDPELALLATRPAGPWSLGARLGVSIPIGRTVENPFRLGRDGLPHEHIQFGTGTWDPVASASVSRGFGSTQLSLLARARIALYENDRDYQAGDRYGASLLGGHPLAADWQAVAGVDAAHETAERWAGRVETEGNLGRTDVRLLLGLGRRFGWGGFSILTQLPLVTRANGQQTKFPPSLSMQWSR